MSDDDIYSLPPDFTPAQGEWFLRRRGAPAKERAKKYRAAQRDFTGEILQGIDGISQHFESEIEPVCLKLIEDVWTKHRHRSLTDISDELFDVFYLYFSHGAAEPAKEHLSKQIDTFMRGHNFQLEQDVLEEMTEDVFLSAWHVVEKRLFIKHLRAENIPEAAIVRLYPPPRQPGPLEIFAAMLGGDYDDDEPLPPGSPNKNKILPFKKEP